MRSSAEMNQVTQIQIRLFVSPGDLLLDGLCVGLGKQIQHGATEVVSVAVGVAQLIGDRVQEQVTP